MEQKAVESSCNSMLYDSVKKMNLFDRIGNNKIILTDYLKHDGGGGNKETGSALLVNNIPNLSVVDIDINKELNEDERQTIRNEILNKFTDEDIIVKTCSGGLHIYCNTDDQYITSNRMIKCFTCKSFDVDIMSSYDENKRNLIVLPGSRVRKNHHKSDISSYEFIRGNYEKVINRSLSDVLKILNINIQIDQPIEITHIVENNINSNITEEFAEVLIAGLKYLEIHNDGGNKSIDKEITLFTLFQAINALPSIDLINKAYTTVEETCVLTSSAQNNFNKSRIRYQNLKTSPFVLVKILRIWNNDYYNEYVCQFISKDNNLINDIDFKNNFCMNDIRERNERKGYKAANEVITDLSKVIRFIDNEGQMMFIQKTYDIHNECWNITFVNESVMSKNLKNIKLWKEEKKTITANDILLTHLSKLTIQGVKFFNNNNKSIFSIFHGYKYELLENIDSKVIEMYLDLIKEVICSNDEIVYNYVLNWISFVIQHPGLKVETALVLKGLQGIGKNRFTDVLCELLSGYSLRNVTEISELTGNFNSVVENKMLIILNELKNAGEDRMANFNALKSIITDNTIRINEKNQPRRTSENISNFIFVTNNSFPIKIEEGDRRYVVLACNGVHKNDFEYFTQLSEGFTKDFYNNLLTFFLKRDISNFNNRDIPMTEAKQNIIEASHSPIDNFIIQYYNTLVDGMLCSDALLYKPNDMKDKNFQLQIKDKCDLKKKSFEGKRKLYYVLKQENENIYSKYVITNDDLI